MNHLTFKPGLCTAAFGLLLLVSRSQPGFAQQKVNYDESKVPSYRLPELLVSETGRPVKTKQEWEKIRRPELLEIFAGQMYGRTPEGNIRVTHRVMEEKEGVLGGKATRRQVKFTFSNGKKTIEAMLLMFIPLGVKGKVPFFVGYNFKGNHSTIADSAILYSPSLHLVRAPEHPDWVRGGQASRWAFEKIIAAGYGVATMCYHDIFPDKEGLKAHSIVSLFPGFTPDEARGDEWQAIGAWAWGSSRIVDYLETLPFADKKKIVIMGHSRQGKAALWAGAQDRRFAIVISNNSGAGGAALSKREFGETVRIVSGIKPAWFAPAFNKYRDNEKELPFDQHELIALMAPRPVYVASAEEDLWADPRGEFLSAFHATPAYHLYGLKGIESDKMPEVNQPMLSNAVGYHIRTGKHDVTEFDWEQFIAFADRHFKK